MDSLLAYAKQEHAKADQAWKDSDETGASGYYRGRRAAFAELIFRMEGGIKPETTSTPVSRSVIIEDRPYYRVRRNDGDFVPDLLAVRLPMVSDEPDPRA